MNYRDIYTLETVIDILRDDDKIKELGLHPQVEALLLNADKEQLCEQAEKHMAKIALHSDSVCEFCEQAGIPKRGALHDDSKWSPQELFESIYFFQGTRSPIDRANEVLGWSPAFQHHVKSNAHHLEQSVRVKETDMLVCEAKNGYVNGGMVLTVEENESGKASIHHIPKEEVTTSEKPLDVAVETICDFCGAAKAYLGDKFTFQGELEWWKNRLQVLQDGGTISPKMADFITLSLMVCAEKNAMLNYKEFQEIYDYAVLGINNKAKNTETQEMHEADDVLNENGGFHPEITGNSTEEHPLEEP